MFRDQEIEEMLLDLSRTQRAVWARIDKENGNGLEPAHSLPRQAAQAGVHQRLVRAPDRT